MEPQPPETPEWLGSHKKAPIRAIFTASGAFPDAVTENLAAGPKA